MPNFQFDYYKSNAPATIADIMQRSAASQAAAMRASGQARAQGITNIGQQIAGTVDAAQQEKKNAPIKALQLESLQNEADAGRQKVAAGNRNLMGQNILASAIKQFGDDPEKVSSFLAKNGFPDVADGYLQTQDTLQKFKKGQIADQDSANAFEGELLQRIAALPTPEAKQAAWTAAQGTLKAHKVDTSSLSPDWNDEAAAAQIALYAQKPQLMTVNAGDTVIDKNNPTAAPLMSVPAKAPNSQSEKFLLDGKPVQGDYVPGANGQGGKYFYQGDDVTGRAGVIPPVSTVVNLGAGSDVKETIAGMKDGTLPPLLPGRASKEYTALMAEAHRQGYDLAQAATDWSATQKHIATLNGAQQTRMAQAVDNAAHSLDVIEDLAKEWGGGKFPLLNKATLAAAKAGTMGPKAQEIATKLEAQISDVTSELGNVYMGGNSPTDHALTLASKNLSANWSQPQLISAVNLARKNLQIRRNSMSNVGVAGASADNPYAPTSAPADLVYDPTTKSFSKPGAK